MQACEKYISVSNHDNGLERIALFINIVIENITIETFTRYILFATLTDNFAFRNNKILLTDDFVAWQSSEEGIKIVNSRNIKIHDNS